MAEFRRRRALVIAAAAVSIASVALLVARGRHRSAHVGARQAVAAPALFVRVSQASGVPAPATALTLSSAGGPAQVHATDAHGDARFEKVPLGAARLVVALPGAARAAQIVTLNAGENRLSVTLGPGFVLRGEVVDDTGAPVADTEIEAAPDDDPLLLASAQSDAGGGFSLADLGTGRYTLRARAAHHELAIVPSQSVPSEQPIRIVAARTSALHGEVLEPSGMPAATAAVTIAGSGVWPPKRLQTDAQGRFELVPIPAGVYELRATLHTLTSPVQEGVVVLPASEKTVRLRLEPGAALNGRVIEAETGQGLVGVEITVTEDALTSTPIALKSGADGRFVVEGLRRLPHRLWIRAPQHVAIAGEEHLPGPQPFELSLRRSARLAGQVVDERGAPVASAEIEVRGTAASGGPLRVSPPSADEGSSAGTRNPSTLVAPSLDNLGVTVGAVPPLPLFALPQNAGAGGQLGFVTDAAGRFAIEGVPAGRAQLLVRKNGYATGSSEPRALRPGDAIEDLHIVLPRGGTLLGRVVDGRGFPIAGARVQVEVESERATRATLSGEDGAFQVDALRGKCTVTAFPLSGTAVREEITLGSGERRQIVLQAADAGRALAGRVRDERGFPIQGARVRVEALGKRTPGSRTAVSAIDGTFRLEGLPPAPYRIVSEHPAYATTVVPSAAPGPDEELAIELRRGARLSGVVVDALSNDGVRGTLIELRSSAGPKPAPVSTDARGKFEIRNLTAGKYELSSNRSGYLPVRLTVLVQAGQDREVDPLVLRPAGTVSGQVVDRLGAPVLDAEV
ncbi:MAG: collagen binding domain-containing protein, partial [Polyangiales bacterium]